MAPSRGCDHMPVLRRTQSPRLCWLPVQRRDHLADPTWPPIRADRSSRQTSGDTAVTDEPKIKLEDFYACLQQHAYVYVPTRALWPAGSIASLFPTGKKSPPAHVWLDRNRGVEQMTYAPGFPMLIEDWYCLEGGWIRHPGARTF